MKLVILQGQLSEVIKHTSGQTRNW